MAILKHDDLPLNVSRSYETSGIKGRKIVTREAGSKTCEVWEQFQDSGGLINPHYHEVEEIITILRGTVEVMIDGEPKEVEAPVTLFIPEKVVHSIRNVGDKTTHVLAFFPCLDPEVIYVKPSAANESITNERKPNHE